LAGGALALVFAKTGLALLLSAVPMEIPGYISVEIDPTVLGFTFFLAIVTGLIFSALPAIQLSRGEVNDVLKEGGRSSAASGPHFVRGAIVVSQIAVAMVLLVAAGLLIKSFARLQQSNFGFDPHNVLTFSTELPDAKYKEPAQMVNFFDQVMERERALPGVTEVATTTQTPLTRNMGSSFTIEGKQFSTSPHAHISMVSPQYFSVMRIPVQGGRAFTDTDRADGAPVAIIDEKAAKAYFQGENPVGKRVMFTSEGTREHRIWREIVGVVGAVNHVNPLENETKGQVFIPFKQRPMTFSIVVMRTAGDPLALATDARRQVLTVDPLQPVERVRSMDEVVAKFVAKPRFNMLLLGVFAFVALLLSAIGVYGVMAYSVTQRTHEFGVRLALGASPRNLLGFVLRQALRLAVLGLAGGLIGAFIANRALSSLLFGVTPSDPTVFVVGGCLLAFMAMLASYLPARRATKVDPMVALRYE
jgi:predicted permease